MKKEACIEDLLKGESLTKKQLESIGMVYQNSLAYFDKYKHKEFFYIMYPSYDEKLLGLFNSLPEEKKEYKLHLCYNNKHGN